MSARIKAAGPTLLALIIVLAALVIGCGSRPDETPPAEVNVDEVPVIGNTADEEQAEEPAEAPANAAAAEAPEPPTIEEPAVPEGVRPEPPSAGARVARGLRAGGVFLAKLIFVLILPTAVAGSLLGMPGGLLVLADAIVFSAFHGWAAPPWWVLLILLLIAVGGETAEHMLSFAGVKQSGASNRTGVWTMAGGFVGAMVGGLLGPLLATIGALGGPVGWVILSIVPPIGLGMTGGFLGGYYYELRSGKTPEEAKTAGWGAMLGRLAGSFAKALLAAVMAAIVLISTWGALF